MMKEKNLIKGKMFREFYILCTVKTKSQVEKNGSKKKFVNFIVADMKFHIAAAEKKWHCGWQHQKLHQIERFSSTNV